MYYSDYIKLFPNRVELAFKAIVRTVNEAKEYYDKQADDDYFTAYHYKTVQFREFLTDLVNGFYDEVEDFDHAWREQSEVDDGSYKDETRAEYSKRKRMYEKKFDWETGEVIDR